MSYTDHYKEMLASHVLTLVQEGPVTAYRMHKPDGGGICSVLLLFTPVGIAIMGDLTPERNGSVSVLGYGIEWFAGHLHKAYLAEKFLTTRWVRELAVTALRDPSHWSRDEADATTLTALDELARYVESGDYGPEYIYETFDRLNLETSDGIPGWGYDPNEVDLLSAIQQRFAELYAARCNTDEHR